MAKDISLEIGFTGGGSTAVANAGGQARIVLQALTQASVSSGTRSRAADGGEFLVDLSNVVFVRWVHAIGRSDSHTPSSRGDDLGVVVGVQPVPRQRALTGLLAAAALAVVAGCVALEPIW